MNFFNYKMKFPQDTPIPLEPGTSLDSLPPTALIVVQQASQTFVVTRGISRALRIATERANTGKVLTLAEATQQFPQFFTLTDRSKLHNVQVRLTADQYEYARARGHGHPANYIRDFIEMDMNLNPIKPMKT